MRTPGSWLILVPLALAACVPSKDEGFKKVVIPEREALPPAAAPAPPPVVASASAQAAKVPTLPAGAPAGVTQAMVEQGAQDFAGVCSACHGPGAAGTPAAPALTAGHKWINISGSYDAIVNIINTGVPHPKEHSGMMPPKGGGNFNDEQVRALAAYVYALSHGSGA
jgi:mono/diheme cytochrome c family protein